MSPTKALEIIRAAVIAANPEIVINKHAQLIGFDHKVTYFEQCRPIRLADVLNAISEKFHFDSSFKGGISRNGGWYENGKLLAEWNLLDDDLNHQSDETKLFLASLLQSK